MPIRKEESAEHLLTSLSAHLAGMKSRANQRGIPQPLPREEPGFLRRAPGQPAPTVH